MLAPLRILQQLEARLREGIGTLPLARNEGLVSLVLELPLLPSHAPDLPGARFELTHAHRQTLFAGYGSAGAWEASGPGRMARLRRAARRASAGWRQSDPDETGFTGFALMGFAASPDPPRHATVPDLPNALLWVPEVALCVQNRQAALILTAALPTTRERLFARWLEWLQRLVPELDRPPAPPLTPAPLGAGESAPDFTGWNRLVGQALAEIAGERLEKVVLCRRLRLTGRRRFDLERLHAALGYLFPSCQVIRIRRDRTTLIAATPERLFAQRHQWVEVDAIAGTARRAAQAEQDLALSQALLNCPKNRREHEVVVRAIAESLHGCSQRIERPAAPRLLPLNNAQHLWSLVRAELLPGVDAFRLAERLHPTPATNGQPCRIARAWLDTHEPFDRGWYTGAAGILRADLTGELWVLLRCAEIRGDTAELYAGAGLVAGSDAESEWQETEHKLAAMSTALQFA